LNNDLNHLEEWEDSVKNYPGDFTPAEKKEM